VYLILRVVAAPSPRPLLLPVQVLLRLSSCGHKVLLFCTMTRCLDLIEEYLTWRWVGPHI